MCGLLLINKPADITSFGAVAKIKKITGEKHIGHTGTLDPMATGVLPVLIGRATKLCDYILCADKCYRATVKLGVITDTLDITGNMLSQKAVAVTNRQIDDVLCGFSGQSEQVPPMFSAIKKDGVRLYRLAREGKQIEIAPRKINILSLQRETDINEHFEFQISCKVSKGTYIRSLVRDMGERLGTGAVLTSLCRTNTAGFDISECVPLDTLSADNIESFLLPSSRAVQNFRVVTVTKAQAFRFSNGGNLAFERLKEKNFTDGEIVRVDFENLFLGLAAADNGSGELKFRCIVNPLGRE